MIIATRFYFILFYDNNLKLTFPLCETIRDKNTNIAQNKSVRAKADIFSTLARILVLHARFFRPHM